MKVQFIGKDKFASDWVAIVKDYAEKHMGLSIPEKRSADADIWLAHRMVRLPKITPRAVKISDVFTCPSDLQTGWEFLKSKVERGEDLEPHLSRQIKDVLGRDEMLMHWQINHFHIGTVEDPKHPGMIEGGSHIVYAFVDDQSFHALALLEHGHWTNREIVETLKRNWPSNIYTPNLVETIPNYTHEEVLNRRKSHVNALTPLSDGSTYRGFGETAGGSSVLGTMKATHLRRMFGVREWEIRGDFNRYFPDIKVEENTLINATLVLNPDFSFSAKLTDLNAEVRLEMETMPQLIKSLRS